MCGGVGLQIAWLPDEDCGVIFPIYHKCQLNALKSRPTRISRSVVSTEMQSKWVCFTCRLPDVSRVFRPFAHRHFSLQRSLYSMHVRLMTLLVSCRRIHVNSRIETKAICRVIAAKRLLVQHSILNITISDGQYTNTDNGRVCLLFFFSLSPSFSFFPREYFVALARKKASREVIAASFISFRNGCVCVCLSAMYLSLLFGIKIEMPVGQRRSISSL